MSKDFATAQEALEFVAQNPTMDELMSRIPPHGKKDIRFVVKFNRAQRLSWQYAQDKRAEKREEEDEE